MNMISKLSMSPAFTSHVRVYYDSDKCKSFYESKEVKKQLDKLAKNGNDDVVTFIPEDGGWNDAPSIKMQVLKKENGKLMYGTSLVDSRPNDIIDSYNSIRDLGFYNDVPNDITIKKYIV